MKDEQSVTEIKKHIEQWEGWARFLKESKWPFPQNMGGSMRTRSEMEAKSKELEALVEEYLELLRQYANQASS